MADTVSIPADIAASLGCTEVDALTDLLRALGAEQAADEWIDAHAEDDDPRDGHFQGTVPEDVSPAADGMSRSPDPADTQDEG
jgi:hypothetical protein